VHGATCKVLCRERPAPCTQHRARSPAHAAPCTLHFAPCTDVTVRPIRLISIASCIYDLSIGVVLLVGREWLARTFSVPSPQPPIFVELNAVFLLAVGIGYLLPYARPDRYRGYLWVMGPLLKGGGALAFVADHYAHGSPGTFLLFALSDATVAMLTLWALLATRSPAPGDGAGSRGTAESRRS
jgi:hypothetical protein